MQYFNNQKTKPPEVIFNQKLEKMAWGVFLIMIGFLALIPVKFIPAGSLLVGTGLILLGLNMIRFIQRLPASLFTTFLGILAITSGFNEYLNATFPILPILFVLIGFTLLIKPKFRKLKI
ncbi:MAG: hypothetical protein CL609_04340 [Anaerolineaceae bacterium]|nr:hypothetical protein [Anaerolineaceae bacterium]